MSKLSHVLNALIFSAMFYVFPIPASELIEPLPKGYASWTPITSEVETYLPPIIWVDNVCFSFEATDIAYHLDYPNWYVVSGNMVALNRVAVLTNWDSFMANSKKVLAPKIDLHKRYVVQIVVKPRPLQNNQSLNLQSDDVFPKAFKATKGEKWGSLWALFNLVQAIQSVTDLWISPNQPDLRFQELSSDQPDDIDLNAIVPYYVRAKAIVGRHIAVLTFDFPLPY